MSGNNTLAKEIRGWLQLAAVLVGGTVIAVLQFQILERQDEKRGYVDILDGIIEMKKWAADESQIMDKLSATDIVREYFVGEGIQFDTLGVEEARDLSRMLMTHVILFYHLEKVYYLSFRSGITEEKREGLDTEITSWLNISGMEHFYNMFLKKHRIQTKEFCDKVDSLYKRAKQP